MAFLLGQSMRPDVLFHTVRGMHIEGVAGELLNAYDDVWVLTFVKDMARNGGVPQEPMSAIGVTTPVTLWRYVHVHKRERGDTNVEAGSVR